MHYLLRTHLYAHLSRSRRLIRLTACYMPLPSSIQTCRRGANVLLVVLLRRAVRMRTPLVYLSVGTEDLRGLLMEAPGQDVLFLRRTS